jgi:hypothetical protein
MNTDSTTEDISQDTSDAQLRAIPQFDGARWKLRLERISISTPQQFHRRSVSRIALGFTTLSPVIFLIAAYVWASFVG